MRDKLIWPAVAVICSAIIASAIYVGLSEYLKRQKTKVNWGWDDPIVVEPEEMDIKTVATVSETRVGDEQAKERDNVTLEIATVEVMVDQLEKMPRATEDHRNAWAQLFMDIEDRFSKIVTYETSDNLNLWKLIGRWATAEGITDKSSYADAPLFHIQRLRPDYQKDEELMRLVAKLNAIALDESIESEKRYYRNFVFFFEEFDTNDAENQLRIGRAYEKGYGLWRNPVEAVKWYKRAASAGNADAIGELGEAYIYGRQYGLEENVETGLRLLNEAVTKGSASAAYDLGRHYVPSSYNKIGSDRNKAIELFLVAAERRHLEAFDSLARQYIEVGNGKEALRWANGGDEPNAVSDELKHKRWEIIRTGIDYRGRCSYIKGEVYALGIGDIEQDLAHAKELFEESYRKGHKVSAFALAAMYKEGIGVPVNVTLADQWKSKAISRFPRDMLDDIRSFAEKEIKTFAKRLREASGS